MDQPSHTRTNDSFVECGCVDFMVVW